MKAKKLMLFVVVIIISILTAYTATAWTEWRECERDAASNVIGNFGSPSFYIAALNFTINATNTLINTSTYVEAIDVGVSGIRAELRPDDGGGEPSATILSYGVNTSAVTAGGYRTVVMNNQTSLTVGTTYWIVWTTPAEGAEGFTLDWQIGKKGAGCSPSSDDWESATGGYNPNLWGAPAAGDIALRMGFNDTPPTHLNTILNLTLTDAWNGTALQTFNVTLVWSNGTTENDGTTSGSVDLEFLSNDSLTVNVSYFNITNYYNVTLNGVAVTANTSNTGTTTTYQSILNLFSQEKISEASISGATYYSTGNSTSQRFNITAATHNLLFTHPSYYNLSDSTTTTALTTTNHTITGVYSNVVNLTAYYSNGTLLSIWGAQITSPTNWTAWAGENGTTTNGSYYFNAINGTYSIDINSTEGNATFTFIANATTQNVTFYYFSMDNCSAFTQVVLNLTILNEATDGLLNDSTLNIWANATSDFLTNDLQFNFSFSTGNYYALCVPNNTVSAWTINAQAEYSLLPTYVEKDYWFVDYPLNTSPTDINLYLTNGTTQVKLQLRDFNDDAIEDAYIKVLSYDLGTNSYRTTEIIKTDSEGDAYAQIVQDTAWYAFLIELDGVLLLQTLPTKITAEALTLRANLDTDYFASYDVVQGVTTDLSYTNATTTFTFTWSDPTGSMAQGCLTLKRQTINGETALNSSCETSTAATMLMVIPGSTGDYTYQADAYIIVNGQNFAVESESVSFDNTYKVFGLSGVFFAMLLILTLVLVGLWHPVAAIVLMVVSVVATNVMGIFYLNWTYIITFIILAAITIYRTGKSE